MYGWWRSFEHFCVPGSQPEAVSQSIERVEQHLRSTTIRYRPRPVIGVDNGDVWRIAYVATKHDLEDLPSARPAQARKYDKARGGGPRGNLGTLPPQSETSIEPLNLDAGAVESSHSSRLWMEIRLPDNTSHFGERLVAGRWNTGGATKPAFARTVSVVPGDRILHYWKQAIQGISTVSDPPVVEDEGVEVALCDFVRFSAPVTLLDVRSSLATVLEVYHATREDTHYRQFPFQINHSDTTKASIHGAPTTYLTAFPSQLVDAIPILAAQVSLAAKLIDNQPEDHHITPAKARYAIDPKLRRAVEQHAEAVALQLLKDEGYEQLEKVGKPYDILARKKGHELHVEVKGSTQAAESVILTPNEVGHASDHETTLIVVDNISVEITDDCYNCSAGDVRRWDAWLPAHEHLKPSQYVYTLPQES